MVAATSASYVNAKSCEAEGPHDLTRRLWQSPAAASSWRYAQAATRCHLAGNGVTWTVSGHCDRVWDARALQEQAKREFGTITAWASRAVPILVPEGRLYLVSRWTTSCCCSPGTDTGRIRNPCRPNEPCVR